MATLTIRNLDNAIKAQLRMRAAEKGRSMEAEARLILESAVMRSHPKPGDVIRRMQARFADIGGVELDLPKREPLPDPVTFEQ